MAVMCGKGGLYLSPFKISDLIGEFLGAAGLRIAVIKAKAKGETIREVAQLARYSLLAW